MKNKKQHPNGYRKISIWKNFWILLVVMLLFTTFLGGRINVKAAAKTFTSSEVANYFNKQVGKSYPSGMCLKFVADSFGNLGAGRSSTCCAYKYGSSHITSKNIDNIPVGADVFFGACGGGPCKTCKSSYYGHIGVYVGDGYFVHATGGKVQKTSLKGTNWKNKYRGWGYHGNVNISQSTSGNNKPESGQQPILSCLDFPEDGNTCYSDSDKIWIQGWFITPDGVACVNAGKAEGSDLVQCSMYSRPDVSNLYPGYPTGSEGFRMEATPAQLQLTPGSNTIVIRGYSKTGRVVEIGKRTINYEPNFFHIDTPAKDLKNVSITSDIYGWVISKKGISKIAILINDVEYEITNRFQRPDVTPYHPGYDVSRAGFSYQIDPTKFRNGMNTVKVRAYTSDKDCFEIYNGVLEGVKMWEGYFDSDYYYARYKDNDVDVRRIGQNEKKLKYHYYTVGIEKGYSPCISFDAKYYKENNVDLRDKSYKFVYEHFVKFVLGNGEIRPLSSWLDLGFYREKYKGELGLMDSTMLVTHHKVYGSREGRLAAATQEAKAFCKLYNPIRYAAYKGNEDVRNAFGDGSTNESRDLLWFHFWYYVLGGNDEHQVSDDFSFNYVKKTYNLKTNMDAFWWYMNTGYPQNLDTIQKTEVSHVHTLEKTEAQSASCVKPGNGEYWICTDCGMLFADKDARAETTAEAVTIPKKPHNWDEGEVLKEPTSTEKGIKIFRCTICDWTEEEKISETGEEGHNHKLVKVGAKDAECLTPGNKAHWLCEECGKIFEDKDAERETTVEAVTICETGHAWDKGKVTKEPTQRNKGEKTFHCTVCGGIKTEIIPELDEDDNDNDDIDEEEDDIPEVGDRIIDEDTNNIYLVTHIGPQKKEVSYLKPGKKSASTILIPSAVTIDGYTYKVVSIGSKAFMNNKKLKKVVIQGNVKIIGKQAFSGCTRLKTVALGTNVHNIGDKTFFQCTALEKITIPSKVSKIGIQTFYKCKKMESITIKTAKLTSKKVGYQAFKGLPSKVVVKVPKGKLNAYKKILISKGLSKKTKIKR